MSWSNLTPEQRGLLRWLANHESEVNNKEYEVAWRPGDRRPVIANPMIRPLRALGSLTKLNIQELQNQQFLTCSWGRDSVKFRLTAAAYKALELKVVAMPESEVAIPIATPNHEKVAQLSRIIIASYSKEELQSLCFEINVEYDDLPGETRIRKAEELVSAFDRHSRLVELWEKVKQDRPHMF